jgi:hypothetical protein
MNKINKDIIKCTELFQADIDREIKFLIKQNKSFAKHYMDLVPMFYPDKNSVQGNILFVGINPSMTENEWDKIIQYNLIDYFSWTSFKYSKNQLSIVKHLVEFQNRLMYNERDQYRYFKLINSQLLQYLELKNKFNYYDLFSLRSTNQNIVLKALKSLKYFSPSNNYFDFSINRFKTQILNDNYKLIISLNSKVSEILYDELNLEKYKIHKLGLKLKSNIYGVYSKNDITIVLFKQLSGGASSMTEIKELRQIIKDML